jgi:hypothetical protein
MTLEEQLSQLEQENSRLKEQFAQRDERIESLTQRLADLEEQMKKNSSNSSLPPSSDRFARQPKSLRKKSGKKPGGQKNHPRARRSDGQSAAKGFWLFPQRSRSFCLLPHSQLLVHLAQAGHALAFRFAGNFEWASGPSFLLD